MLALAALKLDAAIWQINSIHYEAPHLVFGYDDGKRAAQLAHLNNGNLRIVDQHSAYFTLENSASSDDELLAVCKSVLRTQ